MPCYSGPDLVYAGPCSEKYVGAPPYTNSLPTDWIHTIRTVSVVVIDIFCKYVSKAVCQLPAGNTWLDTLWRQRAAQNRFIIISIISGMLLCCKNLQVLLWGPLFCGGPCSAEHAEHA